MTAHDAYYETLWYSLPSYIRYNITDCIEHGKYEYKTGFNLDSYIIEKLKILGYIYNEYEHKITWNIYDKNDKK